MEVRVWHEANIGSEQLKFGFWHRADIPAASRRSSF
jgi:hypothetical protein